MSKLTELTREQFNDFKKIKSLTSTLLGDYTLFGRKGSKFIAKPLEFPFTTTRTFPVPFYITETRDKTYFFELEGESLDSILQHKLVISNRLNSKHNNSQLICWMTKYKSFEMNLWEIFKLGVKVITANPTEIILGCFKIIKGKLAYHYDSWYVSTESIVRNNIQELEKFYFSERALKNIRDGVITQLSENEALFRLAFLILHLGTRDMNLRFYQYGLYQLSQENMGRRLECFHKRYPKLAQRIEGIICQTSIQEYATLEELSSINIESTLMRNFNSSSVESLRRSQEKSIGKVKLVLAEQSQQPQQQPSKKKKIKMKTQQSRILQIECSVLNLLDKMRGVNWSNLAQVQNSTILDFMTLQDYYPVTTYQQKVIRLLAKVYIKIIYSKKQYSNGSIYIGELMGDSREGKGLYLFESGDVFYGDWKDNNMHGFGTYIFKNGDSYEGELEKGWKQGHGKNEYSSGNVYEGTWLANHKKGLGVVYYKNGSMFVGEFFGNQKAAEGIYVNPDGSVLEGRHDQENQSPTKHRPKPVKLTLVQDSKTSSHQIFPDGEYSGQTVDGLRQGYGTLKSETETYTGNWKNNLKHGPGKLLLHNQQIEGTWSQGFIIEYK